MRIRGAAVVLGAALALVAIACSRDDEETATGAATATAPAATQPTSTGAAEEPAETATQPTAAGGTVDPAVIAGAAGKTAAAESARFAPEGKRATVTTELHDFGVDVNAQAPPPGQVTALSDLIRP